MIASPVLHTLRSGPGAQRSLIRGVRLIATLGLLLLGAAVAPAEERASPHPSLDWILDSLAATTSFKEAAVSPDGKAVAWVQSRWSRSDAPIEEKRIDLLKFGAARAVGKRISAGEKAHSEHAPAWSPDSQSIAFLSDQQQAGQAQLYVAQASGQAARRITSLSGSLAQPRWSPDGKQIALLFTAGRERPSGPTQAAELELGEVGEKVPAQRLTLLDVESGRLVASSPPGVHIHEFDWSPDSRQLAVVASPAPGDCNWYVARLCTVSASTGAVREVLAPDMQIAVPRWSPDGKRIAFIGGLMSDEGANGGDIFTVPTVGGTVRNCTPGLKASASWLAWLPSSHEIVFAEHVDGGSGISSLDLKNGRVARLWRGDETIAADGGSPAVSLSRDGKVAALIRHSFDRPPEVWAGPIGRWEPVTHANHGIKSGWGTARSVHWESDSWEPQGWLIYPLNYDAGKRYPLIVAVHGGPASMVRPSWPGTFANWTVLAHEGFFVFFPNPRGSFGQGEAFTRANVKDFGHGDLRDILAGVDAVLKTAPVDPARLGIVGWSYGGYMTMWGVTQTTRFRAAVAGAGIANWQSYYGQNGIDQWLLPYFHSTVYDNPGVYARSSPIEFIKRVRTPTLVVVGERDAECPVPQSREFWHALKTLKVPTQLVVYPGEGHGFRSRKHHRDVIHRTLGWFHRWLDSKSTGDGAREPTHR